MRSIQRKIDLFIDLLYLIMALNIQGTQHPHHLPWQGFAALTKFEYARYPFFYFLKIAPIAFNLLLIHALLSCASSNSNSMSPADIDRCRYMASQLSTNSQELQRISRECIEQAQLQAKNLQDSRNTSSIPPAKSKTSSQYMTDLSNPKARENVYAYCVFNKDKIKQAYGKYYGLSGRIPAFELEFGKEHSKTLEAKQFADVALNELGELIPSPLRYGLPLIPNSADKFSTCDRQEFGL